MRENIFLIGFMGTGKTTVSESLSDLLGYSELDLDKEIERRQGQKVREIFETQGEEAFRQMESSLIKEFTQKNHVVAACGGGAVLRPENVETMKKNGVVVLLCAGAKTVLERVKGGGERPLLNGHMDEGYIAQMMEKRREAYEAAADVIVSTDRMRPKEIAQEIQKKINI